MRAEQPGYRFWLEKAFRVSAVKTNRLAWVDYLRGLAIVLIVYRHVLIGIQRGMIAVPEVLVDANMVFYSFRMPLFFLLSGIFIGRSLAKEPVRQLIWKKIEWLLYPYLVWAFLQVTLQIALSGFTNSDRSLVDYSFILYQPRNLDQFWYLPALFNATIIYVLLKTKGGAKSWMQIGLGVAFYFVSPYVQEVSMLSDWMEFYLFFAIGDAIAGWFFGQRSQRFFRNPWSLLLLLPLFAGAQYYYLAHVSHPTVLVNYEHGSRYDYLQNISDQLVFLVIALVGCVTMFVLAFRLQQLRLFAFLRVVGYHSLYIYVMHVIITAAIRLALIAVFGIRNPLVLLSVCIFFGILLPIVIYNLFIYRKKAWFLFTFKRPAPAAPPAVVPTPTPAPALRHPDARQFLIEPRSHQDAKVHDGNVSGAVTPHVIVNRPS